MQSDATTVDDYLLEVPEKRRAALEGLRDRCRSILEGFEEDMEYGGPTYSRDGEAEVGFASQKRYISLCILRTAVLESHRERLSQLGVGKGCIRYTRPEQIDMDVVESMLRATAETRGPIC